MGKRIVGGDHKVAFRKLVEQNARRYRSHEVFRDFCEMSAITLSNAVDFHQFEKREARYLQIAKRYEREELLRFSEMLAHVVEELEAGFSDVLGSLFMQLELGDHWKGQFFTPYEVSLLMASMLMGDVQAEVERKGFLLMNEPAIGAGAMVIAAADAMHKQGVNYQQHLHVTGIDLDETACHMAYIQLSLLHVPAIIVHGNSLCLSGHTYGHWVTPAHVMGCWDLKLARRSQREEGAEPGEPSVVMATPKPKPTPEPAAIRKAVIEKRVQQATQLSLFD